MTDFRFIHAADIHLDSPLKGLDQIDGRIAERIRRAPRDALIALVDSAIQEQVDFLVIAGDLYDGKLDKAKTGLVFSEQMGRLNEVNIPVFVLHGNHDAESVITRTLPLPENVSVFNAHEPQTFRLTDINVALHGQSFREREVRTNLVPDYPRGDAGAFNIGVLHTALGGAENHGNYAPCRVDDLVAKGYDYWALGHVHQRRVVKEADPPIIFPGNIQGRHPRELGPKGATFVSVKNGKVEEITAETFDVVRWYVLEIDVSGATCKDDVLELIRTELKNHVASADGRLLVARIVLNGRTEIHSELVVKQAYLEEDARIVALGLGAEVAWVKDIEVNTTRTTDSTDNSGQAENMGELQRILADAVGDDALLKKIGSQVNSVVATLPPKLREEFEECDDEILQAAIHNDSKTLIDKAKPFLFDYLLATEIE